MGKEPNNEPLLAHMPVLLEELLTAQQRGAVPEPTSAFTQPDTGWVKVSSSAFLRLSLELESCLMFGSVVQFFFYLFFKLLPIVTFPLRADALPQL